MYNILLYLDAAEQKPAHTTPGLAHLLRNRCTNFLPLDNHRFTPLGLVAGLQDVGSLQDMERAYICISQCVKPCSVQLQLNRCTPVACS